MFRDQNVEICLFLKCFHAVLYIVLKRHVPLPRFPETFSMWCSSIFGTKWHRFHYCCNLWWVQPLYCINTLDYTCTLQWHHNERDGVSNHQLHSCLLNRLFMHRSKKTLKLCVTGFVRGIHRRPVKSPHKGPVTRKRFVNVIMVCDGNRTPNSGH